MKNMDIDSPFVLTAEHVAFYRANGFIKLKNVLSAKVLAHYGREITAKVIELNTLTIPMEQRTTYQKAFLQVMNIWTHSAIVKEFVMGRRLARIAAELMGISGVRLYHDQALYKEVGGGITPWHADQFYWPLASDNTCTAWIPLQQTPVEMGPLAFAARSHSLTTGRDIGISDESERQIAVMMSDGRFPLVEEPFDLGEVSFHSGWTYHRAGVNSSSRPREVMTIIYMDAAMRLSAPKNKNQQNDWDTWCPGAKIGDVIATPINPVIYAAA